jgi:hypothetical protein
MRVEYLTRIFNALFCCNCLQNVLYILKKKTIINQTYEKASVSPEEGGISIKSIHIETAQYV